MIFQLLVRDGKEWCMDVFDKFVGAGDSVCLGEAVIRRYQVWKYISIRVLYQENLNYNRKISKVLIKMSFQPVVDDNNHIVLYIFSSNKENPEFITDSNVELCGSLRYFKIY